MSRMMPPPTAVMMPRVMTPTMSTCAARTAVSPPFSAKAKVPIRPSANKTGGSAATATVYPMPPPDVRGPHPRRAAVVQPDRRLPGRRPRVSDDRGRQQVLAAVNSTVDRHLASQRIAGPLRAAQTRVAARTILPSEILHDLDRVAVRVCDPGDQQPVQPFVRRFQAWATG